MADWDLEALTDKWQQKWWDAGLHQAIGPGEASASGEGPGKASSSGEASASGRLPGKPGTSRNDGRLAAARRPSFFIHFAYPGISGFLHVGHMRGFTYSDVFARYKRQTGHDVLFPAGFHASGIPAVAFAKEVERGEKTDYLLENGYDIDLHGPVEALSDPQKVVEYFAHVYTHDYWKRFGFLIDDRRNCTTVDAGYQRFIQWQFRRLQEKGWLVQKPHYAPFCPVAGPVAVDKSETDIKQGGSAEIQEFLAYRFTIPAGDLVDTDDNLDRIVLPCATLRPETIYGVTNLWVHPDHDYELVRVWRDGRVEDDDESEVWVVSAQGRVKLEWQCERAEGLDLTVPGSALVGATATAPVTGADIPVVAGAFVDPLIATGIVMSVPAHAPFDWAAYVDAGLDKELGEPPRILDVEGYDDLPARQACRQHGVKGQDDDALEAATEQVYSDEFNKGVLNDACGPYAGERVKAVKDRLREDFLEAGHGRIIRQFTEAVISRAGEIVDIKRIPDQDFIQYSDEAWTEQAVGHARSMRIFPQRYADDFENVLRWFGDRACVRRGAWLGTPFPFKEDWIVEPIADSTFYSWYYLISRYVDEGEGHAGQGDAERPLRPEDLTDDFFDYIFNGKAPGPKGTPAPGGDGPSAAGEEGASAASKDDASPSGEARDTRGTDVPETWQRVRDDLLHFGPVDINLGGKEHQTVHFPVWTMNMVGLMDDPALWPRGIFVNWWVTQKAGAKISKSKGGAEPIPGAARKYGVDPMRLYYCHVGSPHVDIEWDPLVVMTYRQHVLRLGRITDDLLAVEGGEGMMDEWLQAQWARHLATAKDAYEAYDLRTAAGELVYAVADSLRWYQRRGGGNAELLRGILREWAAALCPMVPHTAEQMHEAAGGQGLCSEAPFPEPGTADPAALARESYLRAILDDIATVAKLADVKDPEALLLFTTPAWKRELAAKALVTAEDAGGNFPMGTFMSEVMSDPAMRERGKAVQQYAGRLPSQVNQWSPAQKALLADGLDEAAILEAAAPFLAKELGVSEVQVHAADHEGGPEHPKRSAAAPLKPGIVLR